MKAVLIKALKHGTKTISGDVLQQGMGYITLAVTDINGSKSVKRFKLADYSVRTY